MFTEGKFKKVVLSSLLWIGAIIFLSACYVGAQTPAVNQPVATPSAPLLSPATATPTALPDAVVNAPTLNVRSGPDTTYPRVALVAMSDKLVVMGQAYNCTWLKITTHDQAEGWVSAKYVLLNLDCAHIRQVATPATPTTLATKTPMTSSVATSAFQPVLLLTPLPSLGETKRSSSHKKATATLEPQPTATKAATLAPQSTPTPTLAPQSSPMSTTEPPTATTTPVLAATATPTPPSVTQEPQPTLQPTPQPPPTATKAATLAPQPTPTPTPTLVSEPPTATPTPPSVTQEPQPTPTTTEPPTGMTPTAEPPSPTATVASG